MTQVGVVPLLLAQVAVFGIPWGLGLLVGWINPKGTFGGWLRFWSAVCGAVVLVAFAAALLGFGVLSWTVWVLLNVLAVVLAVRSVVVRDRVRAAKRLSVSRHPSQGGGW